MGCGMHHGRRYFSKFKLWVTKYINIYIYIYIWFYKITRYVIQLKKPGNIKNKNNQTIPIKISILTHTHAINNHVQLEL